MRNASLRIALGAALLLSATVGVTGTSAAHAGSTTPKTIWVYRSSFTPSMIQNATGVVVTLVNQDTISHRIVLYRGSTRTSFDVTLAPGQRYTGSEPLTCTGSCYSVTYSYRDANRSSVDSTGYCNSFCARVSVYNDGT
jgi:plastocyanin